MHCPAKLQFIPRFRSYWLVHYIYIAPFSRHHVREIVVVLLLGGSVYGSANSLIIATSTHPSPKVGVKYSRGQIRVQKLLHFKKQAQII